MTAASLGAVERLTELRAKVRRNAEGYAQANADAKVAECNAQADALTAAIAALTPSAADEPVAWSRTDFICDRDGTPIGMDEPRVVWGSEHPDPEGGGWHPLYHRPASAPSAGVEGVLQHVESNLSALFASGDYAMPQDVLDFGLGILTDLKNRIGDESPAAVAPAAMLNPPLPPHLRGLAGDGVVTTARFAGEGGCYGDGCPGCSVCNSTGSDLDQDSPA